MEAEQLFIRALDIMETVFGPEHPATATTLNNLALLYENQGRYAEGGQLLERAIEIDESVFGPDHPSIAVSFNNLAILYWYQGRYAAALDVIRRAIAIYRERLMRGHDQGATRLSEPKLGKSCLLLAHRDRS